MNPIYRNSSQKELIAVAAIWIFLMLGACLAWWVVKSKSLSLINHIEYIEGNRFTRAQALYAEAEKYALISLSKFDQSDDNALIEISNDDESASRSLELFERAFRLDPREHFHPDRAKYYDLAGTVAELVGHDKLQANYHGSALTSLGKPEAALLYLRSLNDAQSTDPAWRLIETRILIHSNRLQDASSTLQLIGPNELPEYNRQRADLAYKLGYLPEASRIYEDYLRQMPQDIDSRKSLGAIFLNRKLEKEAVAAMLPGLQYGGDSDASYLHILGSTYFVLNENEEAIRYLEQGTNIDSNSGELFFSLAQAYHANGDNNKAARALQRAVQLQPELQTRILK